MRILEVIFLPLDTWKIYNLQNLPDLWVVDKGQVTQNVAPRYSESLARTTLDCKVLGHLEDTTQTLW